MNSTELLRSIRDDVVQCTQCDLYKSRTYPVIGSGNHNADIMFIGEAPNDEADKSGIPFSGTEGKVLDKMLAFINLKREDVYTCNIIKCRPLQDIHPTDEQKNECMQYLIRQIESINPKIIVSLGNHATKTIMNFMGLESKIDLINKIHGELFKVDPDMMKVNIMPMYHPAAMLHNSLLGETLRQDFKKLKIAIGKDVRSSS